VYVLRFFSPPSAEIDLVLALLPQVGKAHFLEAARTVRRRITRAVIAGYEEWRDSSGLRSA
jgi:hypothetical protein